SAAFLGPISSLNLTASSLNALSYLFIVTRPLVCFHFISYEGVFRLHFYRSTPFIDGGGALCPGMSVPVGSIACVQRIERIFSNFSLSSNRGGQKSALTVEGRECGGQKGALTVVGGECGGQKGALTVEGRECGGQKGALTVEGRECGGQKSALTVAGREYGGQKGALAKAGGEYGGQKGALTVAGGE
ncbi:hypothetical protein DFP98_128112, partial [Cohnella phaseoli]